MKTIEDPAVVELFKNRLEHELVETVRLIDVSRKYRAPVELDQQSVGRLSRMDAMQQQDMAQDLNRRRQHRKIAIERPCLVSGMTSSAIASHAGAHRGQAPGHRPDL